MPSLCSSWEHLWSFTASHGEPKPLLADSAMHRSAVPKLSRRIAHGTVTERSRVKVHAQEPPFRAPILTGPGGA